jgi:MYXO-CTERM domain-containing protein
LAQKVVAIEDWHINALESNLFEYSSKYTGDMPKYTDVYSASDHDPVLIAIDYDDSTEVPVIELPDAGENLLVEVSLPTGTEEGDTVTVSFVENSTNSARSSSTSYEASATVTAADITSGSINVEFEEMPPAGNYQMTETVKDSGGSVKHTSTKSVSVAASKDDSDGGSTGFGLLVALSGLLAWRRRK